MATISLCMIIRDEAACLPGFLEAVSGLWDELIVVDSGSTDGSQAMITAAGGSVIARPWTDDFAAARNAGIELASGDWILVLDPDETVSGETRDSLRRIADDPRAGAVLVQMRNPMPHGHDRTAWLLRMFRNRADNRYAYAIHEDVGEPVAEMLRAEGLELRRASGDVLHSGYVRERAASKGKKERDAAILKRCIADDPNDLYSRHKLVEVATFWRDPVLAAEAAEELASALERRHPDAIAALHYGGEMIEMLGRARYGGHPQAEREFLQRWNTHIPDSAEIQYRMGTLCEVIGDIEGAEQHFTQCFWLTSRNPQLVRVRPMVGLARMAMARADWASGLGHAEAALAEAPLDVEGLVAWWVCALQSGTPNAIQQRIDTTIATCGASRQAFLALAEAAGVLALDVVADALLDRVDGPAVPHARHRLAQSDLPGTRERLLEAGPDEPEAAIGILICDLIEGNSSHLEIELTLEEAQAEMKAWIPFVLRGAPVLADRLRETAPWVAHLFPDLASWLGERENRVAG